MSNLSRYNLPDDIKSMSRQELGQLCDAIRKELVDTVSKTGGHLASNLGVVELTVALHKVYNFPKDQLIWDVGHQAYVHKLITGRAERFGTLRQYDGISGFPKRKESVYDTFDGGHSSTSISAALGFAEARDIKGTDERVVCVIGDGSMTGGVAFEGLNNVGSSKTSITVILNDNNMSISPSVGGLSKHLKELRTNKAYLSFKKSLKTKLHRSKSGTSVYNYLEKKRDAIRYRLLPQAIFDEFGLKYIGPVDGHNLDELTETFRRVKEMEGPVLVHVITKKGKGYGPAEKNPSLFHGIGPFHPETGEPLKKDETETFSAVFGSTLTKLASEDPNIVAVTAAMTDGTGLQYYKRLHPDRFFDAEIAEQHAVSFAAGLALKGLKPCVAIYSTFLQRAYDQILMEVCLQNLPVVFAIDRAGVVGRDGETHHGVFDLSYLLSMPNMTVLCPRDGKELERMLRYAFTVNGPVAVRYPRGVADPIPGTETKETDSDNNNPQVFGLGQDALILCIGKTVRSGIEAQKELNQSGIKATVVDMRCAKPLDAEFLRNIAASSKYIFTVEDNVLSGGFGDAVSAVISGSGKTVTRFGWPDAFIPHGSQDELYRLYGLDGSSVAEKIRKIIEKDIL